MKDFDITIGDVTANTSMIEEDVIRERFALKPAEENCATKTKKPSEEEYIKAKENITGIQVSMQLSKNRLLQLVDELAREKNSLDIYNSVLDENKKVVMLYEAYKEVEGK